MNCVSCNGVGFYTVEVLDDAGLYRPMGRHPCQVCLGQGVLGDAL